MGCGASSEVTVPFTAMVAGQVVRMGPPGPEGGEGQLLAQDAQQLVQNKIKLVFFACNEGPAKQFAEGQLAPLVSYLKSNPNVPPFEVLVISWDRDAETLKPMMAGPWWTVPYDDANRRTQLNFLFKVQTVPTLVVLGPGDEVYTTNGVSCVMQDPQGRAFPWKPQEEEEGGMMGMLGAAADF